MTLKDFRTLTIFHTECGKQWGGQELRTLVEVEAACRDGHRAWAIVNEEGKMAEYARSRGTPHFAISMKSSWDPRGCWQLARLVWKLRPQVICCHNSRDFYLSLPHRLRGVKILRYRHISDRVKSTYARNFAYSRGSHAVVATAEFIKNQLVEHNGINPDRIRVVGEGVDLERFGRHLDGGAKRREFGWGEEHFVVGQVGMIRGDKGYDVFLRAAAKAIKIRPEMRFLCVGGPTRDGSYMRQMQALSMELGLQDKVTFTGWREDVDSIMAALDLLVLASTGVEGQSRVIPEAFALGKPVIGTRLGGIPELVLHEETGLLVPPGDDKALAAAVVRMAEDGGLRKRCAESGHKLALEKLDIRKRMQESYDLYHDLLDAKGGCGL